MLDGVKLTPQEADKETCIQHEILSVIRKKNVPELIPNKVMLNNADVIV